jgi:hypothetical protein
MAELDTSYRTPRHRSGMDPNTRRLAIIAGGIGAALAVMVGAWSLTGGKPGGIPIVEADARPLRVKPESSQQGPDIEEPATPGKQALAPTPETPRPEALRAQAEKAAAEKAAAEQAAAEKLAADKAAAEKSATERAQLAAPAAPPSPAPAPARPPSQPVALTSPIAPAPAPQATPAARPAPAPAPRPAQSAGATQVQLAAVTSEQAALSEWNRLEKRMPDVLGGRRPAVMKTEHKGKTFFRLRTGGFADTSQASSFCAKVRAKGGTCTVASF